MSELNTENSPLSRRTTPTWEMELLISGATVFGLLQLPQPLNQWLMLQMYSNEDVIASLVPIFGIYLQFSLVALIVTFILHLIARGYWVALVGMSSVYPQGIRWDKSTSLGPIYKEIMLKNTPSVPELIESADNRATRIFGIGFSMAVLMLNASIVVGIVMIVLMFGQARNADLNQWSIIMWSVLGLIFLPYLILVIIDYSVGKHLKNMRWLTSALTFYHRIGFRVTQNPLLLLYGTNEGAKKSGFVISTIMFVIMAGLAIFNRNLVKPIDNGAYDALPADETGAEHVMLSQHYASMRRNQDKLSRSPFIEDVISAKPYLKLFIPYRPGNHTAAAQKQCAGSLSEEAVKTGLALQCLGKLHDIKIDGKPIAVNLISAEDMATDLRGMVAMIDVRNLSHGEHLLTIKNLARDNDEESLKDKAKEKTKEGLYYQIPFWR